MRRPLSLALWGIAALAAVVVVRGSGRGVADGARPGPVAAAPPTPLGPPGPAAAREEPPVDPAAIRDVFRFADERGAQAGRAPAHALEPARPALAATPPPRVRLVGLVLRGGRLVAALSIDDEVVLLGPGQSASGYSVLAVSEEAVRLRGADGHEETLALP